jgi:AcrR family transcriptional regulator
VTSPTPTPTPAPARTDTRQRLIDAACELFWERGYAGVGLAEIVAAAGARAGSLYHFFPVKDGLLLAVIAQQRAALESAYENTLAGAESPTDRAVAPVLVYARFMRRTSCALGCPLTNLAGEVGDSHPAARAAIASFTALLVERTRAELAALAPNAGPAELDAAARAIVAMAQGAVVQARAERSTAALEACETAARRLVISLMGAPAGTSERPEVAIRAGASAPARR